jgi:hypothetical protein
VLGRASNSSPDLEIALSYLVAAGLICSNVVPPRRLCLFVRPSMRKRIDWSQPSHSEFPTRSPLLCLTNVISVLACMRTMPRCPRLLVFKQLAIDDANSLLFPVSFGFFSYVVSTFRRHNLAPTHRVKMRASTHDRLIWHTTPLGINFTPTFPHTYVEHTDPASHRSYRLSS